MKRMLFLLLVSTTSLFSQESDFFKGKKLYCPSQNARAMELFQTGIETLHLNKSLIPKYLSMTSDVFFEAYKIDSTFCDALFFAGYSRKLMNIPKDKSVIACYHVADSLAQNKSIEFKTNLAAEALRYGTTGGISIARKKYDEMITHFPESPEGYYGFAITAPIFGDIEKGLENAKIAALKYAQQNQPVKEDVLFITGILHTLNKNYEEGLDYLEKCFTNYKRMDQFKISYAACLLKVSEIKNDAKMKQKAQKYYDKIENKAAIPEELQEVLKF